jgi:hypothetical protein
MVRFKANLSPTSFENLTKQLDIYAKNLESIKLDIHQALADYVYERIMFYAPTETGELKSSFAKDVSKEIATIYTDLEYARFVEFGTGIIGSGTHPVAREKGWIYDLHGHGEAGWRFQGKDGSWYWTQGQTGKKFMYQAVLDLEQNYIEITRNVLKKKGLI